MTDRERVAIAIWRAEAERSHMHTVAKNRDAEWWQEQASETHDRYLPLADAAIAALRPEAQGVKVRKLEWVPLEDKWNTHTSGRMQITQRGCIPHWDLSCASPEADGYYDTLEAAKAAAQADYEARILSALDRPEAQDGVAAYIDRLCSAARDLENAAGTVGASQEVWDAIENLRTLRALSQGGK